MAGLVIGAVLGGALAVFLYNVAVFIVGAYVGLVLTGRGIDLLGLENVPALVLLVGAVIGGVLLVGLSFELMVLFSAVVGAQMLTLGLGLTAEWTVIFFVIGVLVQFLLLRNMGQNFRRRARRRTWRRRRD